MKIHFFLVLLYTLIGVVFSSSSYSKNTDFNYNAKNLSGYFSALISFNDFDYLKSKQFFKKIKGSFKSPIKVSLNFDENSADACPIFVGRYFLVSTRHCLATNLCF